MRSIFALLRASYLSAASYRLSLAISFAALLASVVPIYFISGAVQPIVADSIAAEGGHYFGFVIIGLAAVYLLSAAASALPGALAGGLGSGTLEALFVTRTPLHQTLLGLIAYPLALALVRSTLLVIGAALVGGVGISWTALPMALVVVALIIGAYLSFGLVAAALVLVFRTSGPLTTAVVAGSGLLGGVYYSTTVIPAWLQDLSALVPLTYGLRALRMLLLGGAPVSEVINDVSALTFMTIVMLSVATALFAAALRHARSAGTLSQY